METYDSSVNITLAKTKQNVIVEQSGEINFKLPSNKSGKQRITFSPPYQVKPKLSVLVSVTGDSVAEIHHNISNFDCTGFTIHVINTDLMNELSGVINWFI
jgi:hypothetical protein